MCAESNQHDAFASMITPPEQLIEQARAGRMFILVDDETRENEGDLVIPAQMADSEAVNFMARFGRGLICLALPQERVQTLRLPLMAQRNDSRFSTAFTVSIEARHGISTGISAPDRARTIAVAIDPDKGADDIVSPGHIFPLVARDGGVLVRAGHTEAAVDFSRLAGLIPGGVICEIMNDDGTMARRDDLVAFARARELSIGTIADLISYRLHNESQVELRLSTQIQTRHGGAFTLHLFFDRITQIEHVALVKGDPDQSDPVLVRMHALEVLADVLGEDRGMESSLFVAQRMIARAGRGVIVLIRDHTPDLLSRRIQERSSREPVGGLRNYGIGAQILRALNINDMQLLSNSDRHVVGLEGYGLRIVGRVALTSGE